MYKQSNRQLLQQQITWPCLSSLLERVVSVETMIFLKIQLVRCMDLRGWRDIAASACMHVRLLPPPPKYGWRLCFHPFLFVCLSVSRISQNVVDGFGRNLVDRLGVWQGWIDSILVKIRIWRIFEVILHHWEIGSKTICSMRFQKSCGRVMSKLRWLHEFVRWQEQAD